MQAGERTGKFRIEQRLGKGGGGEVWRAFDGDLSRPVAIKFPHGDDPAELARFLREARLAGGLSHPNIAGIHEVVEIGGRPAIVMQFVDGGTLRSKIGGDRRELVRLVRDAARAVDHAHALGVVHRDLKPDNLMVDRRGQLFVTDFGLARTSESGLSSTGMVVGTPAYMAPEQARGEPCTPRSDVYSLGATLYELLGGRPPFGRATVLETLRQIQEEEAPPLKGIDRGLEAVVGSCLEKEPSNRYPDAKSLAEDLDRWLSGQPVMAHRPSPAGRLLRGVRRRPILAAVAGTGLVCAVVFAVLSPRFERGADATRRALEARMRERSVTCLDAVLDHRRAGNVAGMQKYADELRTACADVIRVAPESPEPHHQLGRLDRALLRFEEAVRRQSEALLRDPGHAGARYERAAAGHVAASERFTRELDRMRGEAGAAAAALDGRVLPGSLPALEAFRARARESAPVRELHATLVADLAWLDARPLEEARRAFVKGLRAWVAGDPAVARRELRGALPLEEGVEALANLEDEDGRHAEAVETWTKGITNDAGYLPFLEGRSRSRVQMLRRAMPPGRDPEAEWRLAIADLRESLARWPDRPTLELVLASVLTEYGQWLDLSGRSGAPPTREAIDVLDALFARAPGPDVLTMRSLCRLQLASLLREGSEELFAAAVADVDLALKSPSVPKVAWARRACAHFNWAQRRRLLGRAADELYGKAIADYGEALRVDPTDPSLWTQRGHARGGYAIALHAAGSDGAEMFKLALEDLEEAVRRSPASSAEAIERRGLLRVNRAYTIASGQRDAQAEFAAALADFDEAVRRLPGATEFRVSRGHALLTWAQSEREAGRESGALFRRALADFEGVLAVVPAYDEVRHYRGIALTGLGLVEIEAGASTRRFDEGMGELDGGVQRRPELFERRLSRGKARADRGFLEQQRGGEARAWFLAALEDIDDAMRRSAGHAGTRLSRAKVRMNLGVIEANAGRDGLGVMRGAREDAEECVRRFGASAEALEVRGLVTLNLAANGEVNPEALYRAAAADLAKAVEMNPSMPSSWLGLGSAHYVLGQVLANDEHLAAALAAFDRLIALGRRPADVHYRRGLVRKEQANRMLGAGRDAVALLEAAAVDFAEACRVAPGDLEVRVEEAVCWHNIARLRKGNSKDAYRKALAGYEEALKIAPAARERLAEMIEDARKGAQ